METGADWQSLLALEDTLKDSRDRHPSSVHWSLSVGQKFIPLQTPPRHASRSAHALG